MTEGRKDFLWRSLHAGESVAKDTSQLGEPTVKCVIIHGFHIAKFLVAIPSRHSKENGTGLYRLIEHCVADSKGLESPQYGLSHIYPLILYLPPSHRNTSIPSIIIIRFHKSCGLSLLFRLHCRFQIIPEDIVSPKDSNLLLGYSKN